MASEFLHIREKMARLDAALDPATRRQLERALDISWIHHDTAIEGTMLDAEEIVAAVDGEPPVPGSTMHITQKVRNVKTALDVMRREIREGVDLDLRFLKRLHLLLTPDESDRGGRYRRQENLHRSYYHDIAKPTRISYLLKRVFDWLHGQEARRMHPIEAAARLQYRLIRIFPFHVNTGTVCRMFSDALLVQKGYLPAIIHSKDRQRYFLALREPDHEGLAHLMAESIDNCIESSLKYVAQLDARRQAG